MQRNSTVQRPFDDQSQLRVAMESEVVPRAIQRVEQGDLDLLASETLRIEIEASGPPSSSYP